MTSSNTSTHVSILATEGFARFYEVYHPRILRYHQYHVRDTQLAGDLTADTFANAFRYRDRFRGTTMQQESAWLWVIARNERRRRLRSRLVEAAVRHRLEAGRNESQEEEFDRIDEIDAALQTVGDVNDSLDRLTPKQSQAIRMRVIEELDYGEIAACVGVREVIVRKRVSAGLRQLRRELGT
jgi:RNA polymerase sigma-70 factor (ECF subfamily)